MEDDNATCIICDKELAWQDTFRSNGKRIYLCKGCQSKAKTRDIMRRRKSYRAKNKSNRNVVIDWIEDD